MLGASVKSLADLVATAGEEEGGESKEPYSDEEEEVEYEGNEEDEDGEQPTVRQLGGFERFFGAFGQLGTWVEAVVLPASWNLPRSVGVFKYSCFLLVLLFHHTLIFIQGWA